VAELKTPEDLKAELEAERKRLATVWAAYEAQQKELDALREKVEQLEKQVEDKDRMVRSLKGVLETRDREIREMEIELTKLRSEKESFQPKIDELTQALRVEKERFAKLFRLAEELDEDLRQARREIEARDEWFRIHFETLAHIGRALEEREKMISAAKARRGKTDYGPALKSMSVPEIDTKPAV